MCKAMSSQITSIISRFIPVPNSLILENSPLTTPLPDPKDSD